jgi:hypothetical protein
MVEGYKSSLTKTSLKFLTPNNRGFFLWLLASENNDWTESKFYTYLHITSALWDNDWTNVLRSGHYSKRLPRIF